MAIERTLSIVKPDAVSKTTSVKFLPRSGKSGFKNCCD